MKNKISILAILLLISIGGYAQKQFKAFLFSRTAGWHHESIHEGVEAIRKLGERHFFDVDWQENPAFVTEKNLENYQVIIFLNTTGDVLNAEQQKAVEKFVQSGKGFVGIHSASDTEYDWEWYTKMIGMMFKIHPTNQTAYLNVVDDNFPGMERFPKRFLWTDEWYEFRDQLSPDLKFLVAVDEKSYNPVVKWGKNEGKGMGVMHPISWYHPYDGGRAFYTALGHIPATFSDQTFLDHIYGGIYWAATGKGIN
ncbi:MAG: ThuA domain-containing protein [Cytophagaceae bacterium]|nr:ThuA domain-containing protein [Cytophagaceae bacterium]MBK9508498.1 ThuA domain-containing protein [Cytophagaceae bacterium]MBL0301924.1 ThuA domain-containing protein [Cytophagaceae bacterium]